MEAFIPYTEAGLDIILGRKVRSAQLLSFLQQKSKPYLRTLAIVLSSGEISWAPSS
jgi:hypothetical protein